MSGRETIASASPQYAEPEQASHSHLEDSIRDPTKQAASKIFTGKASAKGTVAAELAAGKAAATALPDSDSEEYDEEDSQESSAEDSTEESSRDYAPPAALAEPPRKQPQLASVAQAAGKAAATALPDSDEEAEEDLESQASASMAPQVPLQPRAPAQGTGQAAESVAPGRRLGRLDSLSASDTESVEVQSRPERPQAPPNQAANEAKPAAMPWSLGSSTSAFGQETGPGNKGPAAVTARATPAPSLFGTTAPSFLQAQSASNSGIAFPAPAAVFTMARQSSGAVPPPAFGLPSRQASGALPPLSSPAPRAAQVSFYLVVSQLRRKYERSPHDGVTWFSNVWHTVQAWRGNGFVKRLLMNINVQAPQVPRQSAAQQAIARAREGALAAKAAKPAAAPLAPGPPERPVKAAPSEVPPPKARLQGEFSRHPA